MEATVRIRAISLKKNGDYFPALEIIFTHPRLRTEQYPRCVEPIKGCAGCSTAAQAQTIADQQLLAVGGDIVSSIAENHTTL